MDGWCGPNYLRPKRTPTNARHHRWHSRKVPHRIRQGKWHEMKIGGGKTKPEFKLGEINLEYCSNYKYLGYTPNDKNNMSDHIQALKWKVEAPYQAILAISGNRNVKNIQVRTSIVAITTYGCEIWNPNKAYHGFAMRELSVNYMKPFSFQLKASVVCSVTAVIFIDFCLKKLNVLSQHIGKKQMNIWIAHNKSQGLEILINFLC